MKLWMLIRVVLLISLTITNLSAQQIYHWRDASGKVHYTDDPDLATRNKAAAMEKPKAQVVNSNTTITAEEKAQQLADKKRQLQQQQKNMQRQQQLKVYCDKLAQNLNHIKNQARVIVDGKNADGTDKILNEQQRGEFIAKKELEYQKACGNQ